MQLWFRLGSKSTKSEAVEEHVLWGRTLNFKSSDFNLMVISWISGIVPAHGLLIVAPGLQS